MKQSTSAVFSDSVAVGAPAEGTTQDFSGTGIYAGRLKRLFDIAAASLLLVLVSPVMILIYVLVRLDGGPGLYGHRRVGRHGKPFYCWKIRSMVADADERLAAYLAANPEAQRQWITDRKLAHDPRVTTLGQLLRKSSLDELPQLWNVLIGEMSLVGPRPVTTEELENYGAHRSAYLSVLPGVTGLWQVSGRNAVSYQRRVALDVTYVRNLRFGHDLSILARTLKAVLRGTGS